uniref:RNA-directed RNA polymerase L n=1 Tax=Tongren tick virus 1 TaxID=2972290 RepID=A0A9E7V263_9VIRU|nr:MAG: RNA-dependent RNA polymerase [Tongren tick virus 1]
MEEPDEYQYIDDWSLQVESDLQGQAFFSASSSPTMPDMGALNLYTATTETLKSSIKKIKAGHRVLADDLKRQVDSLRGARHELYASMFQEENSLTVGATDEKHIEKVYSELERLGVDQLIIEGLKNKEGTREYFDVKRFTPDGVIVDINDRGDPIVTIIDYTVTVSPKHVTEEKLEKYRPLLTYYSGFEPNLTVASLSPTTGEQAFSQEGRQVEWKKPIMGEQVIQLFRLSVELTQDLIRSLPVKDRDDMIDFINTRMRSTEKSDVEVNLPFGMDVSEFLREFDKRTGFKWHLESLNKHEKSMFFSAILNESKGESGKESLKERLGDLCPDAELYDVPQFEQILAQEKEEIMKEALSFMSPEPPVEPSKEVINKALEEHDKMAKIRFETIEKSKLVHHIPIHFRSKPDSKEREHALNKLAKAFVSDRQLRDVEERLNMEAEMFPDEEGGGISKKPTDLEVQAKAAEEYRQLCSELEVKEDGTEVKHSRYKAALSALDQVINPSGAVFVLKDLFSIGCLEEEDYKAVKEGKKKMARDHRTGEVKTTNVTRRPSSVINRNGPAPQNGQMDSDEVTFYDWVKTKDCHTVALKKGEVIVVKPSSTFQMREFEDKAGVGRKNRAKGEKREIKKPQSLDISDPEVRQRVSLEFLHHASSIAEACVRIGEQISDGSEDVLLKAKMKNDKTFESMADQKEEEMRAKPIDPGTSSSDSSVPSEKDRVFMIPRGVKPEPGVCKGSIELLGSSPVRGLTGKALEKSLWKGLCHIGRTHQLFYENLSFVSQMASGGYRIVGSNNPGQFLITFPTDSIMKGITTIPYVVMTVVLPGDVYSNQTDCHEQVFPLKCGGEVRLTMGRRVNRDQLTGHLSAFPRFMIAAEIIDHLRSESAMGNMNHLDVVNLYLFVNCININSSSLLDNMRYMVEVCMGQFSYIDKYIEDKLMVPCKTEMHMFMYNRMRELLSSINQSMDTVRMKVPMLDESGTVDVSTLRIVDGAFESYLFSGYYRKPDHLLMELITLFFCTSKGLHGKHHNMVDIHKTPLSIQEPLNGKDPKEFVRHPVEERHQYSPKVLRAATRSAEQSTGLTINQIRQRFARQENPGGHPASVATLSSTSSTLVEADEVVNIPAEIDLAEAELKDKDPAKFTQAINELHAFEEKLPKIKGEPAKRRQWRKTKNRISKLLGVSGNEINPLTSQLYLEPRNGILLRKTQSNKQKIRQGLIGLLDDEWRKEKLSSGAGFPRGDFATEWRKRFRFYDSGVVFTEVLRYSEERLKELKSTTISGMAKDHVKRVGSMRVAIRPKGQRTQKDREIFVIDLLTKVAIYLLEHMYKQICSTISSEKISVPGDSKIIDMYSQTKTEITWCKRTLESFKRLREEASETVKKIPENVYCLHHNIDMTKWAPKDNLQKFNWTIAMSKILTVEEKFFYFGVLDIMWNKLIYLDDDVMLESMKSTLSGDFEPDQCLFYRMTDGYKSNMVPVKQTWLQGQLNYLSSFVHAGAMKLYEEAMHRVFPDGYCLVNTNVHSDDNETTLCCATDMNEKEASLKSWSVIEYLCQNVCIELSKKKSSISMQCKQFISIYNIGGEQIHPWVKSTMAVVSGLPYLTISDDMSSALSKIAEAGSKGAPKKVLSMCLEVTRIHVLDVHGILDRKTGKNRFAEELGIDETMIPMMLGGCHIREWAPFIVCGPKYVDKGNLMHILKKTTGAKAHIEPQVLPGTYRKDHSEGGSPEKVEVSKAMKALKLYVVADLMCYDQADDEENSSACKGMNFFRPCKFKNRRFGVRSPFESISKDEIQSLTELYKKENPCLMLKKPVNQEDLRKYCICQYSDPKFQDSLAGQSPNMLLLRHIQSRNKPRFRLLCTGSMNEKEEDGVLQTIPLDDVEGKIQAGSPITFEEVVATLERRMGLVNPSITDCKMLWRRYIANDPEFKAVQFAVDNCTTTIAYRKLNLVPSRKPNFSQYSEVVNTLPDLLVHFCDDDFANRNGFGLHHPKSSHKDWMEIEKMFPREAACLRWRATTMPGKMKNLIATLSRIEEIRISEKMSGSLSAAVKKIQDSEMSRDKKRVEIEAAKSWHEDCVKSLVKWRPVIQEKTEWEENAFVEELLKRGLEVPDWAKFRTDEKAHLASAQETLPRELVRMSRTFKSMTSRVLFTPPVHADDILEMTLQLRSAIESTGTYQLRMFLSSSLTSYRTLQMLTDDPKSMLWNQKACDAVSYLYEVCRVLGAKEREIREVLDESLFNGRPIMEYRNQFQKLREELQHRSIVPLYVHKPSYAKLLIENMSPYFKDWKASSDIDGRGPFTCNVKGNGFIVTVQGNDSVIEKIDIVQTKDLSLGVLNSLFADLARDIKHFGHKRNSRVNLHNVLKYRVKEEGERQPFLLDVSKNRLSFFDEKSNHMVILGLTVKKIDGELPRDIQVMGLTPTLNGIVCKDVNVMSTLTHRLASNPDCEMISVPRMSVSGFDISKIMSMSGVKQLTKRKMDGVQFHDLLRCMESTGLYTQLYASIQAKVFHKLLFPENPDLWLDDRNGSKGKTNFEKVLAFLKKSINYRAELNHWTGVKEDLQSQVQLGSPRRSMDSDEWEEMIPQELLADMTEEDIQDYIAEMKEQDKEERERETDPEILRKLHECEEQLRKCAKPVENFDVPAGLKKRSVRIMTRLQHFEDINTQMTIKRVDRAGDLLSYVEIPSSTGLIELAKSPVDVLKKIPFSETKEKTLRRRKEKEEGVPLKPDELFENCCYDPMTTEEVELAAVIIGLLTLFHEEKKTLTRVTLRRCITKMGSNATALARTLIEELAAVVDTRAYHLCPPVTFKTRTTGMKMWETTLEDAMGRMKMLSQKAGLKRSQHFKVVVMIVTEVKNSLASHQPKKSGALPKMTSGGGSRALNKFSKRCEKLGEGSLAERDLTGMVFHGITSTEASTTESGSDYEPPAHAAMPSSFPKRVLTKKEEPVKEEEETEDDIPNFNFDTDEEEEEPQTISDVVYEL